MSLGRIVDHLLFRAMSRLLPPRHVRPVARHGQRLRVGVVLWQQPTVSETFIQSEMRWLVDRGVDLIVYCRHGSDNSAEVPGDIRYQAISGPSDLLRHVRQQGRNLLHSHFVYPTVTQLTWPVAERAGIPFTVVPHAVDVFPFEVRRRNRIDRISRSPLCHAMFAYGDFHRRFLVEQGVPEDRLVIKPQSFPRDMLDVPIEISERPIRRIVFVGRFVEKKGLDDLFKAADKVADTDLEFHVYGYGPLEERVRQGSRSRPNVVLHVGPLTYLEYQQVMRSADLFFLPCRVSRDGDMDGLPTVLLEAAAAGVPILTTSLSSIPVLVEDGVTGFAHRPGDVAGFATTLRKLAGRSPTEFAPMLNSARQRVLNRCDPDVVNELLLRTWRRRLPGSVRENEGA